MGAPDTNGVLSRHAETSFKLIVLLLSIAGAGFAASQMLSKPPARELETKMDKLDEKIQQMTVDVAVIKTTLREASRERREKSEKIQQLSDDVAYIKTHLQDADRRHKR